MLENLRFSDVFREYKNGRLLNVLCTFNLHSMSWGIYRANSGISIFPYLLYMFEYIEKKAVFLCILWTNDNL